MAAAPAIRFTKVIYSSLFSDGGGSSREDGAPPRRCWCVGRASPRQSWADFTVFAGGFLVNIRLFGVFWQRENRALPRKSEPSPKTAHPAGQGSRTRRLLLGDGAPQSRPELARYRQLRPARPSGFPHLCQARQPRAGCAVAQKQPALNEIFYPALPPAACSAFGPRGEDGHDGDHAMDGSPLHPPAER